MISFGANLTVVLAGPHSHYGKGSYGINHYSAVDTLDLAGGLAPVVSFAGNIDIVGQDFFVGDLVPSVTFAAALSVTIDLGHGALMPLVAFSGALTGLTELAGNLPVQVALGALLTGAVNVDGDLPLQITFAASELISEPLWASSEPCPSSPWAPSEPCPSSLWTPTGPCDAVDWEKSELCNG